MSPIAREHRHRYTAAAGWPEIRRQVLLWDGEQCAFCEVPNHATIYRDGDGEWHYWPASIDDPDDRPFGAATGAIYIVLTVAHLDHGTDHSDPANLRALCQRCHNRHDREQRQANAARTRAEWNKSHLTQRAIFERLS